MKVNTLYKNLIVVGTLAIVFFSKVTFALADGGGNGYGHVPVDTALAGVTDQTSVFVGLALFTIGFVILASSQMLKAMISKEIK